MVTIAQEVHCCCELTETLYHRSSHVTSHSLFTCCFGSLPTGHTACLCLKIFILIWEQKHCQLASLVVKHAVKLYLLFVNHAQCYWIWILLARHQFSYSNVVQLHTLQELQHNIGERCLLSQECSWLPRELTTLTVTFSSCRWVCSVRCSPKTCHAKHWPSHRWAKQ